MKQEIIDIATKTKPRLAFVGTGWIGVNRMQSLINAGLCEVDSVMDKSPENAGKAAAVAGNVKVYQTFDDVVKSRPDGIVIATPSALHASQSIKALENRIPVFCQKPLARTASESSAVIKTALDNNILLGVDMSYRFTDGMQKINEAVKNQKTGRIFAADLVFHNAYGPDKAWFYNPELAGGGCLIDLGIHLLDLAVWILDYPQIDHVHANLFSGGKPLKDPQMQSEDFVTASLVTEHGTAINMSCSWNLSLGKDAGIKAAFYGDQGSVTFENINGSFFDFESKLCRGTTGEILSSPPDDWGGRALADWARTLQQGKHFRKEIVNYLKVAELIDRIYQTSTTGSR